MKSGEIWLVDFSPSIGDEISKLRPALVMNNDSTGLLRLKIVVPITSMQKQRAWHVRVNPSSGNGLRKESLVDCFQLKSVSQQRFTKKIGTLAPKDMDSVKVCLAAILDLL